MSEQLEVAVGKADRNGRRIVAVVNGPREHRDVLDCDDAFKRGKWRDSVIERFSLGEDAHEWLEGELLAKADAIDDEQPHGRAVVKSMADVTPESTEWLWSGYIPAAAISLIEGDPGLGKSQASLWLAGAVTTGGPMPDGSPNRFGCPRDVVLLSAEDDPARTILPRLNAIGADLARVSLFAGIETCDGDERGFALPLDAAALEATIREQGAGLVIIDPLVAYLASDISMNNDADVRRALKPLSEIAERTGAAIVMLRHLNKKAGTPSMYRGGGSIGIIGAARAAFVVAKAEEDPNLRVLAPVKMNLAKMPPALAFTVEPHNDTSKVVWGDASDMTADQLLSAGDKKGSQVEAAKKVIIDMLEGGPRGSNEIEQACNAEGISRATYWRARKAIGIEAEKTEFAGQWLLSLPADPNPQPYEEFV